ncbi:MAG: uracil-DNA glycosylase family protein, partial [Kofleriaceae bacterium]
KPTRYELAACRPWLDEELAQLAPQIVVLLGATAAQALLGSSFRVTASRGKALVTSFARWTFATVHPAAVLRAPDDEARHDARDAFFRDLAVVGAHFRAL